MKLNLYFAQLTLYSLVTLYEKILRCSMMVNDINASGAVDRVPMLEMYGKNAILILVMYGVSVISIPVVYGVIVLAPILTSSQEPRAPLAQL